MPHDEPADPRRAERPLEPELSPEANRLLDAELRDIAGRPDATLPDRARSRTPPHRTTHGEWPVSFSENRLMISIVFALALAVGAVVSLIVGTWWILVAAAIVAGCGTLLIAGVTIRSTSETEHASPALTERLEDEGVTDPDRLLTDLADEMRAKPAAPRDRPSGRRSRPGDGRDGQRG